MLLTTTVTAATDDDTVTSDEKEAAKLLEYLSKFEQLMFEKQYNMAAELAAASPQGILCTMTTLQRFKGRPQCIDRRVRTKIISIQV